MSDFDKDISVPSKDIIYRQDAIDACIRVRELQAYDEIEEIKALPPAQPERKKGKWIRITQGAMPEQYICPFCHRIVEIYGVEDLLPIRYPYCHCGADMRSEVNEID